VRVRKPNPFPEAIRIGWRMEAGALYRRFLDRRYQRFTLAGLVSDDEPVLLRQIYVPLVLAPQAVPDLAPEEKLHEGGRDVTELLRKAIDDERRYAGGPRPAEIPNPTSTFFISGEAGSGKTTLALSIVTSLAGTVPDNFNYTFLRFLPFPIFLREVPVERFAGLDEFMAWWLEQAKAAEPELAPEHVLPYLDCGFGILLFDGLDELGSVERRKHVLGWLDHRWVRSGATSNLTLVTARPSGFDGLDLKPYGGQRLHVAPFSVPQIRTFLTKWFELRPLSPTRRKEQVEGLIERLVTDERMTPLRALSRRPAYLASLAFVHGTRGALPHTRAALYESVVDAYIDVLDRQRGIPMRNWDRQEKREVLAAVAYRAHVGATTSGELGNVRDRRFTWSRAELERLVEDVIGEGEDRFRTIFPADAQELTKYYIARTGLIVESSEGRYQFGHLSFQEYLAAIYALDLASGAADKAEALKSLLLLRLDKPGWIEVTLLALAVDAGRTRGTGHRAVLAKLDPNMPEHVAFLCAVLSGEEVPLVEKERRAWVIAYMFQAARLSRHMDNKHLVDLEKNRATIEEAWQVVAEAFIAGTSVADALRKLLPPASMGQDKIGSLDPLTAPRSWTEQAADVEHLGAWVLALPTEGEMLPSGAREKLFSLAEVRPWFHEDPTLSGIPIPEAVWTALNVWAARVPEVLPALVARLPFAWICADNSLDWPATVVARWDEGSGGPMVRARSRAWEAVLVTERWSLVTTAARVLDLALTLYRARVLALALTLDRDRDRAWARDRALARALGLARDRPVGLALALDRARDQALGLAQNRPALTLVRNRPLDSAVLDVWERVPSPPRSWRERAAAAMASFYLVTAFNRILGAPPPTPRAAVEAERAAMADPDYLGRDLTDPADRAQARKEWTDFLRSPLSPIPMLDAILATDFTEIDASTRAVTERFEREAEALLREAGAPVPPPSA
jgi:NACHT domain